MTFVKAKWIFPLFFSFILVGCFDSIDYQICRNAQVQLLASLVQGFPSFQQAHAVYALRQLPSCYEQDKIAYSDALSLVIQDFLELQPDHTFMTFVQRITFLLHEDIASFKYFEDFVSATLEGYGSGLSSGITELDLLRHIFSIESSSIMRDIQFILSEDSFLYRLTELTFQSNVFSIQEDNDPLTKIYNQLEHNESNVSAFIKLFDTAKQHLRESVSSYSIFDAANGLILSSVVSSELFENVCKSIYMIASFFDGFEAAFYRSHLQQAPNDYTVLDLVSALNNYTAVTLYRAPQFASDLSFIFQIVDHLSTFLSQHLFHSHADQGRLFYLSYFLAEISLAFQRVLRRVFNLFESLGISKYLLDGFWREDDSFYRFSWNIDALVFQLHRLEPIYGRYRIKAAEYAVEYLAAVGRIYLLLQENKEFHSMLRSENVAVDHERCIFGPRFPLVSTFEWPGLISKNSLVYYVMPKVLKAVHHPIESFVPSFTFQSSVQLGCLNTALSAPFSHDIVEFKLGSDSIFIKEPLHLEMFQTIIFMEKHYSHLPSWFSHDNMISFLQLFPHHIDYERSIMHIRCGSLNVATISISQKITPLQFALFDQFFKHALMTQPNEVIIRFNPVTGGSNRFDPEIAKTKARILLNEEMNAYLIQLQALFHGPSDKFYIVMYRFFFYLMFCSKAMLFEGQDTAGSALILDFYPNSDAFSPDYFGRVSEPIHAINVFLVHSLSFLKEMNFLSEQQYKQCEQEAVRLAFLKSFDISLKPFPDFFMYSADSASLDYDHIFMASFDPQLNLVKKSLIPPPVLNFAQLIKDKIVALEAVQFGNPSKVDPLTWDIYTFCRQILHLKRVYLIKNEDLVPLFLEIFAYIRIKVLKILKTLAIEDVFIDDFSLFIDSHLPAELSGFLEHIGSLADAYKKYSHLSHFIELMSFAGHCVYSLDSENASLYSIELCNRNFTKASTFFSAFPRRNGTDPGNSMPVNEKNMKPSVSFESATLRREPPIESKPVGRKESTEKSSLMNLDAAKDSKQPKTYPDDRTENPAIDNVSICQNQEIKNSDLLQSFRMAAVPKFKTDVLSTFKKFSEPQRAFPSAIYSLTQSLIQLLSDESAESFLYAMRFAAVFYEYRRLSFLADIFRKPRNEYVTFRKNLIKYNLRFVMQNEIKESTDFYMLDFYAYFLHTAAHTVFEQMDFDLFLDSCTVFSSSIYSLRIVSIKAIQGLQKLITKRMVLDLCQRQLHSVAELIYAFCAKLSLPSKIANRPSLLKSFSFLRAVIETGNSSALRFKAALKEIAKAISNDLASAENLILNELIVCLMKADSWVRFVPVERELLIFLEELAVPNLHLICKSLIIIKQCLLLLADVEESHSDSLNFQDPSCCSSDDNQVHTQLLIPKKTVQSDLESVLKKYEIVKSISFHELCQETRLFSTNKLIKFSNGIYLKSISSIESLCSLLHQPCSINTAIRAFPKDHVKLSSDRTTILFKFSQGSLFISLFSSPQIRLNEADWKELIALLNLNGVSKSSVVQVYKKRRGGSFKKEETGNIESPIKEKKAISDVMNQKTWAQVAAHSKQSQLHLSEQQKSTIKTLTREISDEKTPVKVISVIPISVFSKQIITKKKKEITKVKIQKPSGLRRKEQVAPISLLRKVLDRSVDLNDLKNEFSKKLETPDDLIQENDSLEEKTLPPKEELNEESSSLSQVFGEEDSKEVMESELHEIADEIHQSQESDDHEGSMENEANYENRNVNMDALANHSHSEDVEKVSLEEALIDTYSITENAEPEIEDLDLIDENINHAENSDLTAENIDRMIDPDIKENIEFEKIDLTEKNIYSELEKINLTEENIDSEIKKIDLKEENIDPEIEKINLGEENIDHEIEKINQTEEKINPEIEKINLVEENINSKVEKIDLTEQNIDSEIEKIDLSEENIDPDIEKINLVQANIDLSEENIELKTQSIDEISKKMHPVDLDPFVSLQQIEASSKKYWNLSHYHNLPPFGSFSSIMKVFDRSYESGLIYPQNLWVFYLNYQLHIQYLAFNKALSFKTYSNPSFTDTIKRLFEDVKKLQSKVGRPTQGFKDGKKAVEMAFRALNGIKESDLVSGTQFLFLATMTRRLYKMIWFSITLAESELKQGEFPISITENGILYGSPSTLQGIQLKSLASILLNVSKALHLQAPSLTRFAIKLEEIIPCSATIDLKTFDLMELQEIYQQYCLTFKPSWIHLILSTEPKEWDHYISIEQKPLKFAHVLHIALQDIAELGKQYNAISQDYQQTFCTLISLTLSYMKSFSHQEPLIIMSQILSLQRIILDQLKRLDESFLNSGLADIKVALESPLLGDFNALFEIVDFRLSVEAHPLSVLLRIMLSILYELQLLSRALFVPRIIDPVILNGVQERYSCILVSVALNIKENNDPIIIQEINHSKEAPSPFETPFVKEPEFPVFPQTENICSLEEICTAAFDFSNYKFHIAMKDGKALEFDSVGMSCLCRLFFDSRASFYDVLNVAKAIPSFVDDSLSGTNLRSIQFDQDRFTFHAFSDSFVLPAYKMAEFISLLGNSIGISMNSQCAISRVDNFAVLKNQLLSSDFIEMSNISEILHVNVDRTFFTDAVDDAVMELRTLILSCKEDPDRLMISFSAFLRIIAVSKNSANLEAYAIMMEILYEIGRIWIFANEQKLKLAKTLQGWTRFADFCLANNPDYYCQIVSILQKTLNVFDLSPSAWQYLLSIIELSVTENMALGSLNYPEITNLSGYAKEGVLDKMIKQGFRLKQFPESNIFEYNITLFKYASTMCFLTKEPFESNVPIQATLKWLEVSFESKVCGLYGDLKFVPESVRNLFIGLNLWGRLFDRSAPINKTVLAKQMHSMVVIISHYAYELCVQKMKYQALEALFLQFTVFYASPLSMHKIFSEMFQCDDEELKLIALFLYKMVLILKSLDVYSNITAFTAIDCFMFLFGNPKVLNLATFQNRLTATIADDDIIGSIPKSFLEIKGEFNTKYAVASFKSLEDIKDADIDESLSISVEILNKQRISVTKSLLNSWNLLSSNDSSFTYFHLKNILDSLPHSESFLLESSLYSFLFDTSKTNGQISYDFICNSFDDIVEDSLRQSFLSFLKTIGFSGSSPIYSSAKATSSKGNKSTKRKGKRKS